MWNPLRLPTVIHTPFVKKWDSRVRHSKRSDQGTLLQNEWCSTRIYNPACPQRETNNLLDEFLWTDFFRPSNGCNVAHHRRFRKKNHRPIWNFLAPNEFVPFHRDGIWQWQTNLLTVCKRVGCVALQLKVSGPKWYHHQGQVSSWWHGSVFISALVHHWFIIGSSCFIIASSCSVIASSCSFIASLCFVVVLSCYIIDSSLSHHVLLFLIPIGERIWLACSCFSKPGSPCKSASFFPAQKPPFFLYSRRSVE